MQKSDANYSKMLKVAEKYCSRSEKCSYDVVKKLRNYNLSEDWIEKIISELKENQFVDHERYTKAFVNDKFKFNHWGKKKIFYSLRQKDIQEFIINKYLSEIDNDEYVSVLSSILKNKYRQLEKKAEDERIVSTIRFAVSRGFEYELIISELKKEGML